MARFQFKKKKSKKQEKTPEVRSTRSFRVKADLQMAEGAAAPSHEESPATSISDSCGGTVEMTTPEKEQPSTTTLATNPYYRGGGYCRDAKKNYQERWSDENVQEVLKAWKMTDRQRDKLMEFKERVKDVDHQLLNDPHQLVYFLLDESGNVDLAEKWFRKIAQLRRDQPYEWDTLLEDCVLPDDFDYFPICILDGYDREGDAIHVTRTGAGDCWGMYQRHGKDAMVRHALYYQELDVRGVWMDDYEQRMGKKVTRYTYIFDLQGLNMSHVKPGLLPVLSVASRLIQDSYPELVKRVLIVRAPSVFKFIWGITKHFFDKELRDLMVFATGEADSNQVLEKYIDRDVLPHVLHRGGEDGRVARGFEHIVMEGGPLPPEGTYTTPQHCRYGRTRAEEELHVAKGDSRREYSERSAAFSDSQVSMGETLQTNNLRSRGGPRPTRANSGVVCKTALCGHYTLDGPDEILINITSGYLVGLN